MPKLTSFYICQQCGYQSSQFLGKCPQCQTWNSFVEQVEERQQATGSRQQFKKTAAVVNLRDIEQINYSRLDTKIGEFNRVLGGGIVVGSIVLVSGDPGIGKSTLLTQLAININQSSATSLQLPDEHKYLTTDSKASLMTDSSVLYVSGEESAQQIKIRADRISPKENLSVLNETDVDVIAGVIEAIKPPLVIIDSIQTLETADLSGAPGSVGQVRECAHRLQRKAKSLHIPILLVGHVTKEGTLAGPKTLEHLVDVVLSLEGDPANNFRVLRGNKNRFGPTDEVGIFEMEDKGMMEVSNPSKLFLEAKQAAPGSVVVPILTGLRPILVEIQALVTKTSLSIPRRTGSGIDNNRLQLLVAVLQKRLGLNLFDQDIFVNVTGGLKVIEPAADLGVCLSIVSSFKDQMVKPKTALIGEVGLLGEVRGIRGVDKREAEAKKMGFSNIISFENAKSLTQAVKLTLVE